MSDEIFIRYCSPTLAGIKTANLFSCRFTDEKEMRKSVRGLNGVLVKKGIRVLPLRYHDRRALIYAYRPSKLLQDLQQAAACKLLEERGYTSEAPERCIIQLMKKLADGGEFPHEIGLFLGYPPEDVCGFIENKAEGFKCMGNGRFMGMRIRRGRLLRNIGNAQRHTVRSLHRESLLSGSQQPFDI